MFEAIYSDWLKIAPILYYVLGSIAIFSINPKGDTYTNYRASKRLFAMLVFSMGTYIGSLGVFEYRTTNLILAYSINISTYFIAAGLSGYMFELLLIENKEILYKKAKTLLIKWGVLNAILIFNYLALPQIVQIYVTALLAVVLFSHIVLIAMGFVKNYKQMTQRAADFYSDSVTPFVIWMRNGLFILFVIGLIGCIHSFMPPAFNFIYGVLAAAALTYILISFQNYMVTINDMLYTMVDAVDEPQVEEPIHIDDTSDDHPLKEAIDKWVAEKGFTQVGISAEELAQSFNTNRTYLSAYIHSKHKLTYRDWIAMLRIEYSKELFLSRPELMVWQVAEIVGYNRSSFTKAFIKECAITPTQWRDQNLNL